MGSHVVLSCHHVILRLKQHIEVLQCICKRVKLSHVDVGDGPNALPHVLYVTSILEVTVGFLSMT